MDNVDACLLKGRTQSNGKSEFVGEGKGQSPDGRVGQGQSRDPLSHGRGGRREAGQAVDVGAGRRGSALRSAAFVSLKFKAKPLAEEVGENAE